MTDMREDIGLMLGKIIYQDQPCSKKHMLMELKKSFPYIPEVNISRSLLEVLNNCCKLNIIVTDSKAGRGLYRYITKEEDCTHRVVLKPVLPTPNNPFAGPVLQSKKSVGTLFGPSTAGPSTAGSGLKAKPSVKTMAGTSTCSEDIQPRITRSKSRLSIVKARQNFDLVVIGGGSGGLACAKEASEHGVSVAVINYVKPSPKGSVWGLGGTCLNVGCIPKKLMHEAALLGEALKDATKYGWVLTEKPVEEEKSVQNQPINSEQKTSPLKEEPVPSKPVASHNWKILIEAIQDHIKSVRFTLRNELREKQITYFNGNCNFLSPTTLKVTMKDDDQSDSDNEVTISGKKVVIAIGTRPKYPDIPGAREYGITSDDIFTLEEAPGKTLIVGAGYIGMECAGFLKGLGNDVTVMVRSDILGRFDTQMSEMISEEMKSYGVKFLMRCTPLSVEKTGDGMLLVSWVNTLDNSCSSDEYKTVLFAVGRRALTEELDVNAAGINTDPESGKIYCNNEQTNIKDIYAVGDCLYGKPELTPVAIKAGKLLAKRLFSNVQELMDCDIVATTIFTPLEYSFVGLSEDEGELEYGRNDIDVYHSYFRPTEFSVAERSFKNCYCKAIALREDPQNIIGLHFMGPNAGEVIQGFATSMKCGLTLQTLQSTISVHPTVAEEFTNLWISKSSGLDPHPRDCCS